MCVCALTIVSPDEILHYIATLIMIIYYVFKLFCFSDSEVVGLAVPFAVVCAEQHHHRNPGWLGNLLLHSVSKFSRGFSLSVYCLHISDRSNMTWTFQWLHSWVIVSICFTVLTIYVECLYLFHCAYHLSRVFVCICFTVLTIYLEYLSIFVSLCLPFM